tara:strand:+ start:4968 stop:5357 length:390 start_codon:yes stop_codon:yes gene_type:complete
MRKLNKELKMTELELKAFKSLDKEKPNSPDTKLTKSEIEFVNGLYHKYVGRTIDNMDWNMDLDDLEKSEKWPSGQRLKMHEARRIVIGHIETVNGWGNLTDKKASGLFLNVMKSYRKSFKVICFYAYNN